MSDIERWLENGYWRRWSIADARNSLPWSCSGFTSERFLIAEPHKAQLDGPGIPIKVAPVAEFTLAGGFIRMHSIAWPGDDVDTPLA